MFRVDEKTFNEFSNISAAENIAKFFNAVIMRVCVAGPQLLCSRSRVQRFKGSGLHSGPRNPFWRRIYIRSTRLRHFHLKIGDALAIMWQNQQFLRGLGIFNFVLVPNPER